MNESLRVKTARMLEEVQGQREKLFSNSLPILANLEQEKRDFHLKISTISAAIGSFSFLLPSSKILATPSLLLLGDILLLFVIFWSILLFLLDLRKRSNELHESYYHSFEGWNRIADTARKFLQNEITEEKYSNDLIEEVNSIPSYSRPENSSFKLEYVSTTILCVALFLIALSFVNVSWLFNFFRK